MGTRKTRHSSTFFWMVLTISIILNTVFLTKCFTDKPVWSGANCKIVIQSGDSEQPISSDVFMGKVVDFYQSLMNYQFAIVSTILVVGFIYSYLISTRQARDVLDDELYSDHFKDHYLPQIKKYGEEIITDTFNNNDVHANIDDLMSRVEKLEKAIDRLESNPKPTNTKLSRTPNQKTVKKS